MAAIDFPSTPSDGDTFLTNGIYYVYDGTKTVWKVFETGSNFTLNDAQTLDGELPAYYLNYNNFTNTPDLSIYAKTTDLTTDNVTETTNLYYTNARVESYVTTLGFGTDLTSNTTTDLAEGSNLYFTNARALSGLVESDVTVNTLTASIVTSNLLEGNLNYSYLTNTPATFTTGKAIAMAIVFGG